MKRKALFACLALCSAALAAFAATEQTVNDLLPKLAATKVEDRYAAQMELQALALSAARPGAESERSALAGILAARATEASVPQPARVWIVRQLEYIGAAESVTALTALLNGPDAELKECARRALEKNPAPAASEPLRAALKQGGETAWTIGLIQSLGERKDSGAVDLIKPQLGNKETAWAAASALGKIADPKAVAALREAYAASVSGAADALVTAGNRLLANGDKAGAKDLFSQLYGTAASPSGAPIQVRSAALIGWAAADPNSVRPVIEDALQQAAPELQFAAVTAAIAAYGKTGVTAAFVPLLPKLPATAKVYVLSALGASAEKQIMAVAGDADETVRLAALERLGQIGSGDCVPLLFKVATANPSAAQKAAAAALERVSGSGAATAIAQLAAQGDARPRAVAINALAGRNEPGVAPALLKYAGESDPQVSAAACAALCRLGTDKELEGLIDLVLAGKTPCAAAALQNVASRATDKTAAAQKVLARTQSAQPAQLAPLFEILSMLGGREALMAVSSAAASNNPEIKDAAVRALANWPEFPATKSLLVVAFDPNSKKVYNVLAVQGIARLVKSADKEPAAARVDTVLAAMKMASREEDKKLLLSALASVPDKKAADAIKPYMILPQFQKDAALAAMNLAESLRKGDRPIARELAQAVKDAAVSADLTQRANAILSKK